MTWRSRAVLVVVVLALGAALTLAIRATLSGQALDPAPAAPGGVAPALGLVAPTNVVKPSRPATTAVQPAPVRSRRWGGYRHR